MTQKDDLKNIRRKLATARDPSTPTDIAAGLLAQVDDLIKKKTFISAVLLDFSSKLEGEATNFHVSNFVGEGMLQLQSPTLSLASRKGFMKFRLIPAGIEAGKNLGKTEEPAMMGASPEQIEQMKAVNYIARFKFGGTFTAFYSNPDGNFIFKRVEINLQAVNRYLFKPEVMFDPETMKDTLTDKGRKPWYQGDLKFYLVDTSNGRFGFKVSFNRGSLPPVFAETKSFQFGFIVETADDGHKTN